MNHYGQIAESAVGFPRDAVVKAVEEMLNGEEKKFRKVLLLPPDFTRFHSNAGLITEILYEKLSPYCKVDIMPALGTHAPMTTEEIVAMFGQHIPLSCFLVHDWRNDVVALGEVPASFVKDVSEGVMDAPIQVEVNRRIMDPEYDQIFSIGQVVPHEVVGMANYGKNIFVGCGGHAMINATHMLGAMYGMERLMGKDHSPVRKVFDYAQEHFLPPNRIYYILSVTSARQEHITMHGLFGGTTRQGFEQAVELSKQRNITALPEPMEKVVVYLDEQEFKSMWLGNKAVYRTRMMVRDGGELIILAPGVARFGEDVEIDGLIRRFGYKGREQILKWMAAEPDLAANQSAAAHMIHGSSDGRFRITYCTRHLSGEEVEKVGYAYRPYEEALEHYAPKTLTDGLHTVNGESFYYISNPALGLWKAPQAPSER